MVLAAAVTVLFVTGSSPAHAQFGNGAVIVTVPSDEDASAPAARPSPRRTPKTTKPSKREKVTRRRKSAPKRRRRTTRTDKLSIAVLVNDDPITEYEINQRAALMAAGPGLRKQVQASFKSLIKRPSTNRRLRQILKETVEANQGRSREAILAIFERRKKAYAQSLQRQAVSVARNRLIPQLRRKAIQELIEERLKIQAAQRAKVLVPNSELDNVMSGIAKRSKLSLDAFRKQLRRQGTDYNAMRTRVRAQLSWGRLVNAKFGRFVDVNQKTIDESVLASGDATKVSLHLHRFIFKLPQKIDQKIIARRMVEASKARAGFKGCASSRNLTRGIKDIAFRDMGYQVAAAIAEPTRSLLLNAPNGQMAPPVTTREGVALFAVCGRRSGTKSFAARAAAANNLRRKHTEIYGRKHLSDLRREAHIEYRTR